MQSHVLNRNTQAYICKPENVAVLLVEYFSEMTKDMATWKWFFSTLRTEQAKVLFWESAVCQCQRMGLFLSLYISRAYFHVG